MGKGLLRELDLCNPNKVKARQSIANHRDDLQTIIANYKDLRIKPQPLDVLERRLKITEMIYEQRHIVLKDWNFKEKYGELI